MEKTANTEFNECLETEGISKDDVINDEIEQEHKEAEKRSEDFQKDVQTLIDEIKTSQADKKTYFKEVLEGKHPGKKLIQQRLVIQFAEVIDYDKNSLVYEETEADEKANQQYLKSCSTKIDKAALQFANELHKNERFSIESFNLYFREYESQTEPKVKIQGLDLSTGKIDELSDVPPEVLEALKDTLDKIVVTGEKREEKGTEAEAATV